MNADVESILVELVQRAANAETVGLSVDITDLAKRAKRALQQTNDQRMTIHKFRELLASFHSQAVIEVAGKTEDIHVFEDDESGNIRIE